MPSELGSVIAFLLEIDRLKTVERKIRVRGGGGRFENSAEHSWQLCIMAVELERFAAEPVRLDHVIRMLLVHDIGEIDTGDTMAFVEGGWTERKQQELEAVRRIFGLLGPERAAELTALWQEFEAAETAESRFANAVDRAMPPLLNLANGGQSWRENGISYERVVKRIESQVSVGCPAMWGYLRDRLAAAREEGFFAP